MCKKVGLSIDELEEMTVGSIIEFAQEHIAQTNGEKSYSRKASQADFDNF